MKDENSKRTRVEPVFRWLEQQGGTDWPTRLLRRAEGIAVNESVGRVLEVSFEEEKRASPTPSRLAWMIRNAPRLAPTDGRRFREYSRVNHPNREQVLERLDAGDTSSIPRQLRLESSSCCDCLIECENALIWIEGKRNDWLSPGTEWDVSRDQVSRNLEGVWSLATRKSKDYWLLICHENELKHHEECLIEGYRNGTWWGGLPHLDSAIRNEFRHKIGTVRWTQIVAEWPEMRKIPILDDIRELV